MAPRGERLSACLCLGGTELQRLQKTTWKPSRYVSRPPSTKTEMDFVRQHLHQRRTQGILDEPISRKEVCEAVKSRKSCKSPGEDGIVNEVWKANEKLIDYLVEMSIQALEGDVPKEWVDCIIVPVHKKGPVNDPNNYHGITLLSTGGKVFGRVLARHLM